MTRREACGEHAPSGVTVVVPVLDEEAVVLTTLDELDHALAPCSGAYEIIVVDDGSRDRTPGLLAARTGIRVLRHERTRGYGAALKTGIRSARYPWIAVIDADGTYLGKYRKHHIPQVAPGFWEKYYFRPGNTGYPVFQTAVGKVGVYICYDRHFPEGARILGLNGAEIVFNPSATVAGLSEYLWKLEQPAHAVANGYFVGAINRVGVEAPWNIGEFYGQSYFCDPRGKILAEGTRNTDSIVVSDLDFDLIREVRNTWQFYRDRRPETYGSITAP